MKHHAKLLLATTALALACAPLLASAAGKSMGKSNLRAQKIAQDARMPQQPRTMAESDATKFTLPDGTKGLLIATELYPTLSARREADGKVTIVESEGTSVPAATEARPHE
jgi:hypothetical protein